MSWKPRPWRAERGAALIEMALVTPLLLMLLIGIWTTARAFNVQNSMDHAVREAARYAATVDPWDTTASPVAVRAVLDQELANAGISAASVTTRCIDFIAEASSGCSTGGVSVVGVAPADLVAVDVELTSYPLNFVLFSLTVDLRSTATARFES